MADEGVAAIGDPLAPAVVERDPNMEVYESMEVLGEITSGEIIVDPLSGELDSLEREPRS